VLIDIGVNLSSHRFNDDRHSVLQNALDAGVGKLVLTGTSISESKETIDICNVLSHDFPNMLHATVGIHPHNAEQFTRTVAESLYDLAGKDVVVAIGETGLDFYRTLATPKDQQESFVGHIELAEEIGLPLFLHERDAAKRQLEILSDYREHISKAVIHCFTGDRATLHKYLDLDLYIGITGWICDVRRGSDLQAIVADIPLNRLMIETDAPYLLPQNMIFKPKNKRNEPAFLPWIAKKIANHRLESVNEIINKTSENAKMFFEIE
tara:strand:- start:69 stop:866 length:798 start_codon:yes stop_codon:yes gene_type:complete